MSLVLCQPSLYCIEVAKEASAGDIQGVGSSYGQVIKKLLTGNAKSTGTQFPLQQEGIPCLHKFTRALHLH